MKGERDRVLKILKKELASNGFWKRTLENADALTRVHLGIFREPYLGFIAAGAKTIESRFSKNRIAPFESAERGDIVLLKGTGKGIAGVCVVDRVWFYRLQPGTIEEIRDVFGHGICPAEPGFWEDRRNCAYCSLIWISHYVPVPEFAVPKRDRRGWVVLT